MRRAGATKKKTTLADLDKGVTSRRVAPRLAPAAARSRARSVNLGADVLAQIDLVKGKNNGSRKRGLLGLLHPNGGSARQYVATARAYDIGAPIRISGAYSGAFAASLSPNAGSWVSATAEDDGDQSTTAFAIEVFEEDASVDRPPVHPTRPMAARVSRTDLPVQRTGTIEVPVATALNRGLEEDGMLGLDLSASAGKNRSDDADQFEREIQAILSGKTTRPAKQASAMSDRPEPAAGPAEPSSRPHDIFEQMGRNMAYANAFNLPPMELGKRFDDIEGEIIREEAADVRRPQPPVSLELSDDEISASLRLPRGLMANPAAEPPPLPASTSPGPSSPIKAEPPVDQPGTAAASTTPTVPESTLLPGAERAPHVTPPPSVVAAEPATTPAEHGRPLP